jgi:hypothetical protein
VVRRRNRISGDRNAKGRQPLGGEDDFGIEALGDEHDLGRRELKTLGSEQVPQLARVLVGPVPERRDEPVRVPLRDHRGVRDRLQELQLVAVSLQLENDGRAVTADGQDVDTVGARFVRHDLLSDEEQILVPELVPEGVPRPQDCILQS